MRLRQTGFSLIELMIGVAIMGILSAVAVPSYNNYVRKSVEAKELALVDQYKKAISLCFQMIGDPSVCKMQDSNSGIPANIDEGTDNNDIQIQYKTTTPNANKVRLVTKLYGHSDLDTIKNYYEYDIPSGNWSFNAGYSNCIDYGYC